MTLEELINKALERGEFVHLSVVATGKMFEATFASASRAAGYSKATAAHPIIAMEMALEAAPMVRKSTTGQSISFEDAAALL